MVIRLSGSIPTFGGHGRTFCVGALEGSAGHIVKRLLGGWSLPGVAYIEVGGRLTGGKGGIEDDALGRV